jgi:feruloyl esterase
MIANREDRKMHLKAITRRLSMALNVILLLAGFCASASAQAASCANLGKESIPASAIALAVRSVVIESAIDVNGTDGKAGYCTVKGHMAAMDPAGWPILFQVNLPDAWNGKVVQYGGGGTNGFLISGLRKPGILPPDEPSIVAQGYVTFGTDAGHPMLHPDPAAYVANKEALINQAYASYKKVHDLAIALVRLRYGKAPQHTYFFGESEGGREALLVAQRFPDDYDGIIAIVPIVGFVGQNLVHYDEWIKQRDGGWLPPGKTEILNGLVLEQCDGLDGLEDGIVANQAECRKRIDLKLPRCANGRDTARCFTDAQIAFVESVYERLPFAYPLANGVSSYPGSPYGQEAAFGGIRNNLMVPLKPQPGDFGRPLYGPDSIRMIFAQDPKFDTQFDMTKYRKRLEYLSRLYDVSNPDLSGFASHGKLILIDNMADYLKTPFASQDYYEAVVKKLGQARTDNFMQYYQLPGLDHGSRGTDALGKPVPNRVDVLGLLDNWVEKGTPPKDVVISSYATWPPGTTTVAASHPMCAFPAYPKYRGTGDVHKSDSFECALP